MKSLKPEEKEHYEKLFTATENHGYGRTPGEGEHIQKSLPSEQYRKFVQEWDEIEKYHTMPREKEGENEEHPADYYHYGRILERMYDTHRKKNSDYGDAAYRGYKKYGPVYFIVQLHNKLSRLESLTINNKTQMVKGESIDDTLLDMANYAVMYLESRHRND